MEKEKTTYKLPEGWIWSTIPKLFIVIGGGTPSKNNSSFWGGNINWASVKDVKSQYLLDTIDKISLVGVQSSNTSIALSNDIILVTRISPGQVCIVKNKTAVNQDLKILKLFGGIDPLFVYYLIKSQSQQFISNSSGTTVKGLKISDLNNIKLPLPPLNEQNRIISKIEELFSELDYAEAGLKKAQKQLEICRQALLKRALLGELLSKESEPKSSWKNKYLGDVVVKTARKAKPDNNSELKFIGLESIDTNSLKLRSVYLFKNYNSTSSYFKRDNIIYSRMRPSLNKVHKAEFDGVCSGEFFVLECLEDVNIDFLKYLLHSSEFVRYATKKATGDRPRLSFKDFCDYQFYIPKIEEQKLIVQVIESRITLMDNLNDSITIGLKKIVTFQNAILKKAFEGSLIPQNSNDESAFNLLRDITKEKEDYLTKKDIELKNKIRPKMKQNLIDTIKKYFSDTQFTFEELSKVTSLSYDDIKEQLYELLDKESKLTSIFSEDSKCIIFKFKK